MGNIERERKKGNKGKKIYLINIYTLFLIVVSPFFSLFHPDRFLGGLDRD